MGKKYDETIARIKGITEALDVAAHDIVSDIDDERSEEMKAVVRSDLKRKALETRVMLNTVVEAIDGDLEDKPDKEVARGILVGSLFTETLLGLIVK